MEVLDHILHATGNTPLVRLHRVTRDSRPTILAKLESLQPGGSVKDRIALKLIEEAEHQGVLRPGGTIVEPTSGNTGHSLAMAAAIKGYRMVFTMPDKVSAEKIALLRAYGADVVICPTNVPRESAQSYYSVAERLSREIPGAFQPNQYFNPANPRAHYETTGPELWRQTDHRIDVFVAGMGTGGTISGVARYLKERKPAVAIVGADAEGSLYSSDTVHPYKIEGIGEDFLPGTMDLGLVDRIIPVADKDAYQMARRLAREEGILVGSSSGAALVAALAAARDYNATTVMVVLFPDTGRNYLSKVFNDEWMRNNGFLEQFPARRVREALKIHLGGIPQMVSVPAAERVGRAIDLMQRYGISQMPVVEEGADGDIGALVGSIQERTLLDRIYRDPELVGGAVGAAMDPPFPTIDADALVDEAFDTLLRGAPALVVVADGHPLGLLTKLDLLEFVAQRPRRE